MLSVLIVNWNTRDLLRACLRSIFQFAPKREFEVIVVDNDSHDGSAEMVESEFPTTEFPNLTLIRSGGNLGYAKGNNLAFAAAKGDLLLTLNPDTEFLDEALEQACQELESRPEAGALSIRQIGTRGETQRSIRGFPTVPRLAWEMLGGTKLFPNTDQYFLRRLNYDEAQWVPQPMATFTLLRRSALAKIGDPKAPFDERFPIFFNDVDLMYRLHKANLPCWYTPTARILHHGGEGTKQVRKSMIWESHRSLLTYLRKHAGTGLASFGLFILTPLVLAAAFVRAKGYHAGFRP